MADVVASSSTAPDSSTAEVKDPAALLAQGKRDLLCGEAPKAVNSLQDACAILAEKHGEMGNECAEAYYFYGKALLELARMENSVLGNALQGVPDEEETKEDSDKKEEDKKEEEKDTDDKFENPDALDGEEREKIHTDVYNAMAEKEKEGKEGEKKENEKEGERKEDEKKDVPDKVEEKKEGEKKGEATTESEKKENGDVATEETKDVKSQEKSEEKMDTSDGQCLSQPKKVEESDQPKDEKKDAIEKEAEAKKENEGEKKDEAVANGDKTEKDDKESKKDDKVSKKDENGDKMETNDKESKNDGKEAKKDGKEAKKDDKESSKDKNGDEAMDTADEDAKDEEGDEGTEEEGDSQDEGEETKDEEDPDDVPNLQLAWEMLELAKVIFKKQGTKDMLLKAAQALLTLGEVGLETEQYEQSITDLKECLELQTTHLEPLDRRIAETNYQLGLAQSFNKQFDDATQSYKNAVKLIEDRIAMLDKQVEEADAADKGKAIAEADNPIVQARREIEDMKEILPDIMAKIEDAAEEKKNFEIVKAMAREATAVISGSGDSAFGSSSGFGSSSTSSSDAQPIAVKKSSDEPAKDISAFVRKKRKPEESAENGEGDGKKPRQEENGTANGHCNGSNGNETAAPEKQEAIKVKTVEDVKKPATETAV